MSGPSAKPLFRAISGQGSTVKEPLPLPLPLDAPVRTRPRVEKRRADDFYPTGQPEAVRGLLARDGDAIRACGSVWEPACGDGALVREIRSAGIPCCASDLIDRGCPDSWVADYYSCLRSRSGDHHESALLRNQCPRWSWPLAASHPVDSRLELSRPAAVLGLACGAREWPRRAARQPAIQLLLPDALEAGLYRRGIAAPAQCLVRVDQGLEPSAYANALHEQG